MLPWEASLQRKKRVTFLTGTPTAPSVLLRWADRQPLFPRKGNHFWFSVPAERRHKKMSSPSSPSSKGQRGTGERTWGALTCTSWHRDEGKCTAAEDGWTWGCSSYPRAKGCGGRGDSVWSHTLPEEGREGKGISGRKHWSSFLLLCPAQMCALTFLKEGV